MPLECEDSGSTTGFYGMMGMANKLAESDIYQPVCRILKSKDNNNWRAVLAGDRGAGTVILQQKRYSVVKR